MDIRTAAGYLQAKIAGDTASGIASAVEIAQVDPRIQPALRLAAVQFYIEHGRRLFDAGFGEKPEKVYSPKAILPKKVLAERERRRAEAVERVKRFAGEISHEKNTLDAIALIASQHSADELRELVCADDAMELY